MTDELKPVSCGCGGEAEVLHPSYTHCIVVMCDKCGIKTPYMNSEAEAITAWNRAMGATDMNVGDKERISMVWKPAKGRPAYEKGICSCGYVLSVLQRDFVYCPHCGAKLDWSE